MVQILPFCGWRYDLSQVGALSEVTAPTSRRIDEGLQRTLYRQHPCNVIRLVMNREEPGDASPGDRSERADDFFRLWKRERILRLEHEAAFYIIETTFRFGDSERVRWNVIARLRLPNPSTESDDDVAAVVQADADSAGYELELRRVCNASLMPVVGLLQDTTGEDSDPRTLSDHLASVVRQLTPVECIDDSGVRHRMWPVTDFAANAELETRLSQFAVRIIGGAAAYQAAILHRDELQRSGRLSSPNDPANTVLACLIPAEDPGIEFLPGVLSVSGTRLLTGERVRALLSSELVCQKVGSDASACDDATELARLNHPRPSVAVGTCEGEWMLVSSQLRIADEPDGEPTTVLVDRVLSLLASDSTGQSKAFTNRLPLNAADSGPGRLIESLQKSADAGVMIVIPQRSPADLFSLASRSVLLEDSLFLHPGVPTGLVFSSLDI